MNTKKNPWLNNEVQELASIKPNTKQKTTSLNDIDLRRLIATWPYVLAFGLLGFWLGKVFTRYTVNTYSISTKVNIQQKEEITLQQAVSGTTRDPFNDRIAYFKSPALSVNVADNLKLMYEANLVGKFKEKSLYGVLQWRVLNADANAMENKDFSFTIQPTGKTFQLVYKGETMGNFVFNKPFVLDGLSIVVMPLKTFSYNSPIVCKYVDKWIVAAGISANLVISAGKESNIIDITYTDVSTDRAKNILNLLVEAYNNVLSNDKSRGFSQAISFINQRLHPLAQELDSIENNLSNFQSQKGFVSENANGALYLDKVQEIDKKMIDVDIQKANIDSVEKYLNGKSNTDINFAIIGIDDVNLQNNLSLLAQLKTEKAKLLAIATPDYPNVQILEKNIAEVKNNIRQQISSYKQTVYNAKQLNQNRLNQVSTLIKNTPKEEKELIDIKRMRNVKEALLLTLIQKREEAAIAKASTTVDTKILSPATVITAQQKPSKATILIAAPLLGMLLPIVFFLLVELLNTKIVTSTQLENYLSIPVVAELEFVQKDKIKSNVFLGHNDRTMFGEQLRALRTQLSVNQKQKKTLSILITSNMSGEGKSFLSLNLAKSFSIQGKKVALVEFDLRRPKIVNLLNLAKAQGMSSFLLGNIPIQSVTMQPFEDDKNFHFYQAGPIPINPQELLSEEKLNELKAYFDATYDVVIIDTPPYGIVADAQLLGKIADLTLIVTRFNYTIKDQIVEIEKWHNNQVFPSMAVIFNGIKQSGYYGYKYGYYYYKSKYGYNYYAPKQS